MELGFFPNRQNMYKEVQQWIALNKLDMLIALCNCCTYKVFGCTSAHQCRTCHVRRGILKLSLANKRVPVEGEELLGVC